MSGKTNRRRGFEYERELVHYFEDKGHDAQRAWGSNGRSLGCAETVDVVANGCRIQAKRVKSLSKRLSIPDGADVVIFREDHGKSYVLLHLDDFAEMIKDGW